MRFRFNPIQDRGSICSGMTAPQPTHWLSWDCHYHIQCILNLQNQEGSFSSNFDSLWLLTVSIQGTITGRGNWKAGENCSSIQQSFDRQTDRQIKRIKSESNFAQYHITDIRLNSWLLTKSFQLHSNIAPTLTDFHFTLTGEEMRFSQSDHY